jgi:hypothetical protein
MATATHIPTKLMKGQFINAGPQIKFDTDTMVCLLVQAGSGIPSCSKTGVQFIADVTATNTEESYSGYARQTLTGQSVAFDSSTAGQVDFTFSAITFPQEAADDGLARYGVIADTSIGSGDSTHPVIAILDFGQTVSTVNGQLVLTAPTPGIILWTGGG